MDPSGHYPDPFGEALSHSSQRVTQLTSLVAAAAEVAIRLKAARAAGKRRKTSSNSACWISRKPPPERRPGPGGHPPMMPGGWPRLTCSRLLGPGAPPPVCRHRPRRGVGDAQERGTPPRAAPVRDGPL